MDVTKRISTRGSVAMLADVLSTLALIAWVGGHAALGAFGARIAFAELPREDAARTFARVFHEFDRVIVVSVGVLAASAIAGALVRGRGVASQVRLGLELGLCALGLVELVHVHPGIEALFQAGRTLEPGFWALHRLSERCGHAEVLLAAAIVVIRALPAAARSGAPTLVLLAFAGLATLGGCTRKPSCGTAVRLELRDGAGALQLRIATAAGGGSARELDLCDPAGQRLGTILYEGAALRLLDRAGGERLRVADAETLDVSRPGGPGLRLYWSAGRNVGQLRVLRPDGVPHGTLTERDGAVVVSDPGGSPVAKATPRDADVALLGPDGAVRGFVLPSPGLWPAAVFAIDGIPLEERAFLAVQLARERLLP